MPPKASGRTLLRRAKALVKDMTNAVPRPDLPYAGFSNSLIKEMYDGPLWARSSIEAYALYIQQDLVGTLQKVVGFLESSAPET
jgi:hypothetical protein